MNFKPQCETQEQLFLEMARVCKMCEGTGTSVWGCVKISIEAGIVMSVGLIESKLSLNCHPHSYEFAIAIIEGKPVFRGDDLYCHNGNKRKVIRAGEERGHNIIEFTPFCISYNTSCSWNPPLPKTVMVELPIEIASTFAKTYTCSLGNACRKSLDSLKGA